MTALRGTEVSMSLILALSLVGMLKALLILALVGFVVWLIITYIPMPDLFKKVLMVVLAVLVILWLISAIGGGGDLYLGL